VIRSSDYSGDIGEFIAKDIFKLRLNPSKREEGFDASDKNGVKYEIKFHSGSNRNNIIMSKYKERVKFEKLIVILGLNSKIKPNKYEHIPFIVYIIEDYDEYKGKNIAKTFLGRYTPNKLLDKNLEEIADIEITK